MRYLNFTAVDTNTNDANGLPVIEYLQTGQGLSADEKAAAARWLLNEVSGKCEGTNPLPLTRKQMIAKEMGKNMEEAKKVVDCLCPNKAKIIYDYLQTKMHHIVDTNKKVFEVMEKLKTLNPADQYLEAYQGHYQRNGDKFLDYYHILHELAKEFNFKHVMEIGCRTGISLCQLLSALKDNGRKMPETIDLFDVFNDGFISPALVKLNVNHIGCGNVVDKIRFHVGDSKQLVPNAKDLPLMDWLLVDGSHDRNDALQDLINVEPLLAPNGIICFDDVAAPPECDLLPVWNQFKKGREDKYYWLESMVGKGFALCIRR